MRTRTPRSSGAYLCYVQCIQLLSLSCIRPFAYIWSTIQSTVYSTQTVHTPILLTWELSVYMAKTNGENTSVHEIRRYCDRVPFRRGQSRSSRARVQMNWWNIGVDMSHWLKLWEFYQNSVCCTPSVPSLDQYNTILSLNLSVAYSSQHTAFFG